jgi:hypothetical protein
MSGTKYRSVVAVFNTQAEATARATLYASQGYVVYVPTNDAGALPPLTGSTTEVLLDFVDVVAGFPAGGVLLKSPEEGDTLETIVAGVPATGTPPATIESAATKVFILKDRFKDGRDLIAIENAGLAFDNYAVFVPTPAGPSLPAGTKVNGKTAKLFLDATDALRNLTLPGILEVNAPLVVKPVAPASLWVVTARKVIDP